MTSRLSASDVRDIADTCVAMSHENARVTVRVEHGQMPEPVLHPEYEGYFRSSLDGALDALTSQSESSTYGAPRPLTDTEVARVRKVCDK